MAETYDLIFSLGAVPLVSQLLKDKELQIFDFPFDNVSCGTFLSRMTLLLLDCEEFIEQKNIIVKKDYPREGLIEVSDAQSGLVFQNEFNADIPIENSFPLVKAKYTKCIRNLKTCIKAAKSILILYVENPQIREDDTEISELLVEASVKLKQKYPKKNIKILYVKNDENAEYPQMLNPTKTAKKVMFNFYKKFSEMSAGQIDTNSLAMVLADVRLKKSAGMKKILFFQKIINFTSRFTK